MANTEIEESRLAQLVTDAGRAAALESELAEARTARDTFEQERNALIAAQTVATREGQARSIIAARATEAGVQFSSLEERGLMADLPLAEDALDATAFTTTVDEAAAERARANGAGTVRGFGSTGASNSDEQLSESDIDKLVAAAFGHDVQEG